MYHHHNQSHGLRTYDHGGGLSAESFEGSCLHIEEAVDSKHSNIMELVTLYLGVQFSNRKNDNFNFNNCSFIPGRLLLVVPR